MASFAISNLPFSTTRRHPKTLTPSPSRSIQLRISRPCVAAKAMAMRGGGGVAKFKGTQRRERLLTEMIEKKVLEATEVCEGNKDSDECKVAWDEVEEVSQAMADLRRRMENQDPLESFCSENPETDECRIYED
ncbi:hypothetical protein Syun_014917 [Stephania yunnanensis]|uniref:CP12 domain-containing protein n=1 Tax=Stephania yunnanensis TaxID=152371 RepID=A0AAP0JMI3_9MAGN